MAGKRGGNGGMENNAVRLSVSSSNASSYTSQINLYLVQVLTQDGQKIELQLSPWYCAMDVRHFLLATPWSCYFTCYDLVLHTSDGLAHHLKDYNEIADVADISNGECHLKMVAASYDDQSIKAHVHRTRELLSLPAMHSSLSTLLVQLHDDRHDTCTDLRDSSKIEMIDIDNMEFLVESSMLLPQLFVPPCEEIQCVQSLELSSFSPPPTPRFSGGLIYLDVVTLEGNKYCITGTTQLFYANITPGNVLDPRSRKSSANATTLVGLLQKLSPKFRNAFEKVLAQRASAHPLDFVPSMLPSNSWLGFNYAHEHKRDTAIAENASTLSHGNEARVQRDWNEELQSCRELPHTVHGVRIPQGKALHKITTNFVNAAMTGAVEVITESVLPINQEYVHNNIFFSFAFDADMEKLPRRQVLDSISETKSAYLPLGSIEKNVSTKRQLPTYASTNNDLKGTKAYHEADVSGLYTSAMTIIDYRGHRVLAQSIVPDILLGSILYGSIDNGNKFFWNEEFHSKIAEAATHLHMKEHSVLDGSGNAFTLATPVECKGIIGSDGRHYLLDLTRVTPRDANFIGPGFSFSILRSELISAFCHVEAENLKSKSENDAEAVKSDSEGPKTKGVKASVEVCDTESETKHAAHDIRFNPNVFAEVNLAGNPQEIAMDKQLVKNASLYLKDYVLPKFVTDLRSLKVSPMDGQNLTEALHEYGINVRYLGKVAELTRPFLHHIWELCSNEIVVRSAKHILKDVLRDTEELDLECAIAHFFNCLFGNATKKGVVADPTNSESQMKDRVSPIVPVSSKNQGKTKHGEFSRNNQSYLSITSDGLWSDIQEFAKHKYEFELEDEARLHVKKIHVIRNLCQKVGITIAGRTYQLTNIAPFQNSDILNLQPVVKHALHITKEARDLVEHGKVQLAQGMLSEAYTSFSNGLLILIQVIDPMHREVGNCYRYLAMVLYHAGDMAGAIEKQRYGLIISERCLGLDHPDTAHSYVKMALYYHGMYKTELAIWHMNRGLLLLSVSCGLDHPDIAATFIYLSMMYQDSGNISEARRVLEKALEKNIDLLGEKHAIAILHTCVEEYKLSRWQREEKTDDILIKILGEDGFSKLDKDIYCA